MYEALKNCASSGEAVLDFDLQFLSNEEATGRDTVIKQLVMTFGTDEDPQLQKISFENQFICSRMKH